MSFRNWFRLDLNDPVGSSQRFADGDLDRAVDRAVAELSLVWPRETDTEQVCAATSRLLELSGNTYSGLIAISEVE